MIVEEQGIDFRTGVRFPSAPLLERPHNCWKIQCLCGFLVFSGCTKRKPKRLKKRLFSGQISHEVSHEKRAKKPANTGFAGYHQAQKRNDRYHTTALNTKTKKRTRSKPKDFRVRLLNTLFHEYYIPQPAGAQSQRQNVVESFQNLNRAP